MARSLMEGLAKYLESLSDGDVVAEVEDVYDVPAAATDADSPSQGQVVVRGKAHLVYAGPLGRGKYLCDWWQDKQLDREHKVRTPAKEYRSSYLDDGKHRYTLEPELLHQWPRPAQQGHPCFDLADLFPFSLRCKPINEFVKELGQNTSLRATKTEGKRGHTGLYQVTYSWESSDSRGKRWNAWILLIDKTRGCLATVCEYRIKPENAEAFLGHRFEYEYKRHRSGLFLPKKIVWTQCDDETGKRTCVRTFSLSFKSIGKPIDDRRLTLEAMNVPLGTPIHYLPKNGGRGCEGGIYGEPRGFRERAELLARILPDDGRSILEKKLSFDFAGTPLTDVIACVSELTGLTFSLDPKVKKRNPLVTLKVAGFTLQTALDWVVTVTDLDYTYHQGAIFISDIKTIQKVNSASSPR